MKLTDKLKADIKKTPFPYLALIVLFFYLLTNAPSVVQIDSGELATAQALPGVAHPTGYPLFILLGYFLTKIFFFYSKIKILNLFAAFCVLFSTAFIYKSVYFMLNAAEKKEANKLYASAATLLLAFSVTFWSQSASVEVYSLHLFLSSVVIYNLLLAHKTNEIRNWIYFALSLALAFGNHMTTVMIIPSAAFLFFQRNGFGAKAFKKIAIMLAVFFPVLILEYSFLVFLAAGEPKLNWGYVVNLENLFRHLTGKQYQVWMFSGVDVAKKQLAYFVSNLGEEFAYFGLIPVILGFKGMKKSSRVYFVFSLTLFFSVILYAINYDIHDIDAYFLLAYVALSFFAAYGFATLGKILTKKFSTRVNLIILLSFVLIEIFYSFSAVSQRQNFIFEDYTKASLSSLEKNSVVLTYQWDYFVSPSYYFRYIENFRNDVAVIDKELLRRSWYYKQLSNNYPEILVGTENTVKDFLRALRPFEKGGKYNAALLEKLYRAIISGIISNNVKKRSVYIAPELVDNELKRGEFQLPEGFSLVPCNYFYKVVPATSYYDCPITKPEIRFEGAPENRYSNQIKHFVKTMMLRRALYEMQFQKNEKARIIIKQYKEIFPKSGIPKIFDKLFSPN